MNEAERYLRAATRGLWGRQRRALRDELRGHLGVRVQELRLGGLSEAEAERQTLRELGAPGAVSRGMLGVHTLPALGRGGLVSLMAATLLVSTLPRGQAQVNGFFLTAPQSAASAYLDFSQLQAEVAKTGGKLSGTPEGATLTLPGVPPTPLPGQSWPGATLKQQGRAYLSAEALVFNLLGSGADLRLSGWTNPTLRVGRANLHIQTNDWRVPNRLYSTTLYARPELTRQVPLDVLEPNGDTVQITLKGDFEAGKVYALVTPIFRLWSVPSGEAGQASQSGNMNLVINAAVARQGQVTFRIYNEVKGFKVMPGVEAMHRVLDPYLKSGDIAPWEAARPAPALVLALSGHFGPDAYSVVSPQRLQVR